MKKLSKNPKKWYFDVSYLTIGISTNSKYLDDNIGYHNLPMEIALLMDKCGVNILYSDGKIKVENYESVWELKISKMEKDVIESMINEGFNYIPGLLV